MTGDYVSDDEELYRSVRADEEADEYYYDTETGNLVITSQAFRDREQEPSVDRAHLRNSYPAQSRIGESDGIVSLFAGEVREIGDIFTNDPRGNPITNHNVDVIWDPIPEVAEQPENPAHSLVVVEPEYLRSDTKGKAFSRLKKALARLATKRGWTLEPETS